MALRPGVVLQFGHTANDGLLFFVGFATEYVNLAQLGGGMAKCAACAQRMFGKNPRFQDGGVGRDGAIAAVPVFVTDQVHVLVVDGDRGAGNAGDAGGGVG